MLGQEKNLKWLMTVKEKNNLPKFIIINGAKGSGKRTLCAEIAKCLDLPFSQSGIKVDEIREVIESAYTNKTDNIYCIPNADTMRNEAKNALLKITEEPPKNSYFILTVSDDSFILDTLKSRAFVLNMESYTPDDIAEFAKNNYPQGYCEKMCNVAQNLGQFKVLNSYGEDFLEYVSLVLENIYDVEFANAFKSGTKLAFKDEEDKYDLTLFFETFRELCVDKLISKEPQLYCKFIQVTDRYVVKSMRTGVNKQQLYDMWVFDIRECEY